jgi:hypothetical protein
MKIFVFTIGLIIPFIALFIGLQVSPLIASIILSPIMLVSTFFNENFVDLPFYVHALLVLISGLFYLSLFIIISKLFIKKINKRIFI